jgi:hypothetical protein
MLREHGGVRMVRPRMEDLSQRSVSQMADLAFSQKAHEEAEEIPRRNH